jgi:predicted kinase
MQPISRLKAAIINADRPTVTMLIGAQGTGKTTLYKGIAADLGFVQLLSTDEIIERIAKENGVSYTEAYPGNIGFAEDWMMNDLANAVARQQSIIVDRTNMSRDARAKILTHIPGHYLRFAVILSVDPIEQNRRLNFRAQTGKSIPQSVVADTLARYEPPTKSEFDEIFS